MQVILEPRSKAGLYAITLNLWWKKREDDSKSPRQRRCGTANYACVLQYDMVSMSCIA